MQESNRRRPARVGARDNDYYYEDDCCCSTKSELEELCEDNKGLILAGIVALSVFLVGIILGRISK